VAEYGGPPGEIPEHAVNVLNPKIIYETRIPFFILRMSGGYNFYIKLYLRQTGGNNSR
jgi:hypothetical protein